MPIPILTSGEALRPMTGAAEYGRLLLITQSKAMSHFDAGRITEGEALALEMEEFHTLMQNMSEEEVRAILEGVVAWTRFCVDLAHRAALDLDGR